MRLFGTLTGSLVRGYSAYEIAVMNGFEGTEEEWITSLKGDKGDPGEGVLKYVKDDPSDNGGVIEGYVDETSTERNRAEGSYSHAEGAATVASGNESHAEGHLSKATEWASHAEGFDTVAGAPRSHAEGYGTIASSANQHVQGKYNVEDKRDEYAFIIGNGNYVTRSNAYTLDWEGNGAFAGKVTAGAQPTNENDLTTKKYVDNAVLGAAGLKHVKDDPSDNGGVIEGFVELPADAPAGMTANIASGKNAHAEGGMYVEASGGFPAESYANVADGDHSHAEGAKTVAHGNGSHAQGFGTIANGMFQTVLGMYNAPDTTSMLIIGNGTSDSNRSNALAIKWDGTFVLANGTEVTPSDFAQMMHAKIITFTMQGSSGTTLICDTTLQHLGTMLDECMVIGHLVEWRGNYIYREWYGIVMFDAGTYYVLFPNGRKYYNVSEPTTWTEMDLVAIATTTSNGLMSATDKQHLDEIYSALKASGVI